MSRYLCWDFDGTLAYRDEKWSGAVRDAILVHQPTFRVTLQEIRPYLSTGFPWHTPEVEHRHLASPEAWWLQLQPVFRRVLTELGVDGKRVPAIVQSVRDEYLRAEAWKVVEGAPDTLAELASNGWHHVIVSNHVPELNDLVVALGLAPYFEHVFGSAEMGVEKPHPAFLAAVLEFLSRPEIAWVIGDSVSADIASARAAGVGSILVGSRHPSADYCVRSLRQIPGVLSKTALVR
jgi:putative hydrolase of the HAD superfamily